ncbi:MAG: DivIVA domain-containing protein [Actinomycetota bacterium]|nr:DivIVA domain-containing protein [Actinomycetota bacterium]
MIAWIVVSVTCVVGLVVTLIALLAGERVRPFVPLEPSWLMPTPSEARSASFPLAWRGYHPASVDVFMNALAAAYEELYHVAGPDLVSQARERLARRGAGHPDNLTEEVR